MNAVQIFNAEAGTLSYTDKKDRQLSITPEGAMFKGGKELTAKLRDAASASALIKAQNGRYRAASDILCAAFPAVGRKASDYVIDQVWSNKASMGVLLVGVESAMVKASNAGKALTAKQMEARALLVALRTLPAFAPETREGLVIENGAENPTPAEV